MEAEMGKVTVSGDVEPETLIRTLKKNGKHVELIELVTPRKIMACGLRTVKLSPERCEERKRILVSSVQFGGTVREVAVQVSGTVGEVAVQVGGAAVHGGYFQDASREALIGNLRSSTPWGQTSSQMKLC
nr:heavy metal-associated isoprenylated plant protein 32-like [Ipomoea trifida]